MIKTKSQKEVSQVKSDGFMEVVRNFSEDQTHLTSKQFQNYLFEPEKLDKPTIEYIQNHISICERCRVQVEEVENNKELYMNLPCLDS